MNEQPLVTVIIPVFNGERYLAAALDSVFAQHYRPLEVIVVDDGSTDGTAQIARRYAEVHYRYQDNQGHGAARNHGISVSRGGLIAFLDADDLWLPTKLSAQVAYLQQHPEVGCVIARMQVILDASTSWPASLNYEHYASNPVCYLPSALVTRRRILDKIGLFETHLRHASDSEWFLRVHDSGIGIGVVPAVLLQRRIHATNLSREKLVTAETLAVVRASIQRRRRVAEDQKRIDESCEP